MLSLFHFPTLFLKRRRREEKDWKCKGQQYNNRDWRSFNIETDFGGYNIWLCAWRLLLCVTLSKQRECWKLRDWRLSSEFDSRVHGQPSIHWSLDFSSFLCFFWTTWVRRRWKWEVIWRNNRFFPANEPSQLNQLHSPTDYQTRPRRSLRRTRTRIGTGNRHFQPIQRQRVNNRKLRR